MVPFIKSIITVIFLIPSCIFGQELFEGKIYDYKKDPLPSVVVSFDDGKISTISDSAGYFKVPLNKGTHKIQTYIIGFQVIDTVISFPELKYLELELKEDVIELGGVTVKYSDQFQDPSFIELSKINDEIGIFGEKDVVEILKNKASVQSGVSRTGTHVRGGASDQNLILLDGGVVLNPTHLFGFYSTFNSQSIGGVKFYDSYIPAEYGGRLSSVLSIESKNLYKDSLSGEFSTGLISSKAMLQKKFYNKQIEWFTSFRKTYFNHLIAPVFKSLVKSSNDFYNGVRYDFYDINNGFKIHLSERSFISLSLYKGGDVFSYLSNNSSNQVSTSMAWGNFMVSSSLDKEFVNGNNLSVLLSNSVSDYSFDTRFRQYGLNIGSYYEDVNFKTIYSFKLLKSMVKIGTQYLYNEVVPNNKVFTSNVSSIGLDDEGTSYSSLFSPFSEIMLDGLPVELNFSLRLNLYKIHHEVERLDIFTQEYLSDWSSYLSPRILIKWRVNDFNNFVFEFSRNHQFLHQVSVAAMSMPADFWIPSDHTTPVAEGNQSSFSYNNKSTFFDRSTKVSLFGKRISKVIEYQNSLFSSNYESKIDDESYFIGDAYSFGVEFYNEMSIKKNDFTFTYVFSRALRKFDELNNGESFFATYDRPHDFTFSLKRTLKNHWIFNLKFIFASGELFTLPKQRQIVGGYFISRYSNINSYRFPNYHRLDVGFSKRSIIMKNGNFKELSIGVYNLYNRQNPYIMYFGISGSAEEGYVEVKPILISLHPFLPSISYKIVF